MTTTNIRLENVFGKPAGRNRAAGKARFYYIDNLRILLTILVIMTHLAIGYGAPGDWYYNEAGDMSDLSFIGMTLLVVVSQAFFMGFFFFLSSYFTPGSLDRKGSAAYLADRFKRLGIPLLFFALIISPLINYGAEIYAFKFQGSFWQFIAEEGANSVGFGPMWFVETLLILSIIYTLGRRLMGSVGIKINGRFNAPGNLVLALFALALGIVTFIVRIWAPVGYWFEPLHLQLAHFPQYICLFVLGIIAYRSDWLSKISSSQGKFWLGIVLILVIVLFPILFVTGGGLDGELTPFLGGLHWQSAAYSVWEQFLALGMIVVLLVWFRSRLNRQGKVSRNLSSAAYTVYIVHTPLIIFLAVSLNGVKMDLGMKYALVTPLAILICFAAGHVIRKLPFTRGIL